MQIRELSSNEDYTHLALIGRLDIIGVGEIENKFIGYTASRKKSAVVDLSGVSFLGSMGLRVFLSAAKALALDKKKLVLFAAPPLVKDVLSSSGIDEVIPVEDTLEAALAKI